MPVFLQPQPALFVPQPVRPQPRLIHRPSPYDQVRYLVPTLGQRGLGAASPFRRWRGLGTSTSTIQAQIAQSAIAAGLDPTIALAQAAAESEYNPNATNPTSGAAGLFQFMPATAAQYGITNPYDPTQSITGRNAYYSALLTQFGGDQAAALAAYDWGPGNVQKAQAKYGSNWLAYAPSETQDYVAKILGASIGTPSPTIITDAATVGASDSLTPNLIGDTLAVDMPETSPSSTGLIVAGVALAGLLGFFVLPDFLE